MLTHSPWLQFVTGLPDSQTPRLPKSEAKGVVLVKGSWYETLGSLGLPFDLNQSLSFPSLSQLDRARFFFFFFFLDLPCADVALFFGPCRSAQARSAS